MYVLFWVVFFLINVDSRLVYVSIVVRRDFLGVFIVDADGEGGNVFFREKFEFFVFLVLFLRCN